MKRLACGTFAGLIVGCLITLVGCGAQQNVSPPTPAATPSKPVTGEQQAKIDAQLAKLSESDRALAIAQNSCPVTEMPLGSMGKPIKLTVKGKDVFICCAGCEDKLKENFDEYAQKLNSAPSSTSP